MTAPPALAEGYVLTDGTPSVADYLALRSKSGLSPRTEAQAIAGLPGSWTACHIVHTETGVAVGMGRIIADGGWYFHIIDIAVLPEHQRRGLGDVIMTTLMQRIRAAAGPGAYVNLLADPPGRRLYARHGFKDIAPEELGMGLWTT